MSIARTMQHMCIENDVFVSWLLLSLASFGKGVELESSGITGRTGVSLQARDGSRGWGHPILSR
jgi:hypothetical protein